MHYCEAQYKCDYCLYYYYYQHCVQCVTLCLQSSGTTHLEPDPYVVVKLGNTQRRTSVKESATNPTWEEQFEFLCTEPALQELSVSVCIQRDGFFTFSNFVSFLS